MRKVRYRANNTNNLRINRPSIGSTSTVRLSYLANVSPDGNDEPSIIAQNEEEIPSINSVGNNIGKQKSSARLDEKYLRENSNTSDKSKKSHSINNKMTSSHLSEVNIKLN